LDVEPCIKKGLCGEGTDADNATRLGDSTEYADVEEASAACNFVNAIGTLSAGGAPDLKFSGSSLKAAGASVKLSDGRSFDCDDAGAALSVPKASRCPDVVTASSRSSATGVTPSDMVASTRLDAMAGVRDKPLWACATRCSAIEADNKLSLRVDRLLSEAMGVWAAETALCNESTP
jgi:hypothetical protein